MKATDVRVYEAPFSDAKFSWDYNHYLTWEELGTRYDLVELEVHLIRTEVEKRGVATFGDYPNEIEVHLANCDDCDDCRITEDISSMIALYS